MGREVLIMSDLLCTSHNIPSAPRAPLCATACTSASALKTCDTRAKVCTGHEYDVLAATMQHSFTHGTH
jgi:hypothetical protein